MRSSRVEAVGLQEDSVADADLADVVEQARPLELLQLRLGQPHDLADLDRDRETWSEWRSGARIPGVDGGGQGADGLREHVPDVDHRLVGGSRRVQRQREHRRHERSDERVGQRHQPGDRRQPEHR